MQQPHLFRPGNDASTDKSSINPMDVIRVLRPVSGALLSRASLYAQLLSIEWAEQKARLTAMLAFILVGTASLLCAMIFAGVLIIAIGWETAYRIPLIVALIALYGIAVGVAWYRFKSLSAIGDQAFAATRAEFAADIALIKDKL